MMGRNRSLDETEVVHEAVERFWTHGLLHELERAMGKSSTSFNDGFRDKRFLFKRSLQRHFDRSNRQRVALLDAGQSREAIEALVDGIVEASSHNRDGCLLVNSAADVAAHDAELGADVAAGPSEMDDPLHRAVMRCQADGPVTDRSDAAAFAEADLGTIVSIGAMPRSASGTAYLRVLVDSQVAMPTSTSAAA